MKNKSGFTLIELLAVIAIIGILSGIGIISLSKVFEKNRNNYYISQEKMINLAGKNYVQDYRSELPKEIGQMRKITLKTLENRKYINKVLDYKTNICDKDNSYVLVQKTSLTKYEYYVNLDCPDYKTDLAFKTNSLDINFKTTGESYHQAVNVTIKSEISEIKIGSYNYIIYKDNKEIKNSGNIANKSENNTIKFTVDLNKLGTGKYTIKVIAYDNYKTISSKKSDEILIDKTGPSCGSITGQSTKWINTNRTISVKCKEEDGSGCEMDSYSKTFANSTKTSYITIYDKAGNKTNCKVNVYIDKKAPTCKSSGESSNWKRSITLTGKCADTGGSGCKESTITKTITTYVNDDNYRFATVIDNAGNIGYCKASVKVDDCAQTIPSITSGSCSKNCGGGTKTVKTTYTSTRGSNFICKTETQNNVKCNIQDCCSKINYTESSECSASCGGGKKKRLAYSAYDNSRCSSKDDWNGSVCNTQDCCSSVRYVESSECSASCGGGKKKRLAYSAYDNSRCSSKDDFNGAACNTQSCGPTIQIINNSEQHIGKWICGSCKTTCSPSYQVPNGSGGCLQAFDGRYGNTMGIVNYTINGNTVTFNWEIRQGNATYINTSYHVDFIIRNSSGTDIHSVRLKEDYGENWSVGTTHTGSISYTFNNPGTYKIYILGNSNNPSFDMDFGTITVN